MPNALINLMIDILINKCSTKFVNTKVWIFSYTSLKEPGQRVLKMGEKNRIILP